MNAPPDLPVRAADGTERRANGPRIAQPILGPPVVGLCDAEGRLFAGAGGVADWADLGLAPGVVAALARLCREAAAAGAPSSRRSASPRPTPEGPERVYECVVVPIPARAWGPRP